MLHLLEYISDGKVERGWLYRVLWFLLLTENRDQGESVRALSRLFHLHISNYAGHKALYRPYGKKGEGRKRGVQAEIVLHLLEYISDGKGRTELAVSSTLVSSLN